MRQIGAGKPHLPGAAVDSRGGPAPGAAGSIGGPGAGRRALASGRNNPARRDPTPHTPLPAGDTPLADDPIASPQHPPHATRHSPEHASHSRRAAPHCARGGAPCFRLYCFRGRPPLLRIRRSLCTTTCLFTHLYAQPPPAARISPPAAPSRGPARPRAARTSPRAPAARAWRPRLTILSPAPTRRGARAAAPGPRARPRRAAPRRAAPAAKHQVACFAPSLGVPRGAAAGRRRPGDPCRGARGPAERRRGPGRHHLGPVRRHVTGRAIALTPALIPPRPDARARPPSSARRAGGPRGAAPRDSTSV